MDHPKPRPRITHPVALATICVAIAWTTGLVIVTHQSATDLVTELVFDALFIGTACTAVCLVIINAGRRIARVEHGNTRNDLATRLPERVAASVSHRIGERTMSIPRGRRIVSTTTYAPIADLDSRRSSIAMDLMEPTGEHRQVNR